MLPAQWGEKKNWQAIACPPFHPLLPRNFCLCCCLRLLVRSQSSPTKNPQEKMQVFIEMMENIRSWVFVDGKILQNGAKKAWKAEEENSEES